MKRISRALMTTLIFVLATPTKADLGTADIDTRRNPANANQIFRAWCGTNRVDCSVAFNGDRMIVDNQAGINNTQIVKLSMSLICRRKAFGFAFRACDALDGSTSLYDKEFRITYQANTGEEKTALITFRNQLSSDEFKRDLEIWSKQTLRPVGPSISIE